MAPSTHGTSQNARLTSRFSAEDIAILDPGLGTTLEDVLHKNISHPLWSAHLIETDPESIVAAHLAFLKAGSSIILTATYQCAPETFSRAGYGAEQGRTIMHKAVALAVRARGEYMAASPPDTPKPKIALSLGPYGAMMSPAAEFTGIYPPPYGPPEPATFFSSGESPKYTQGEQDAENALAQFHLERLQILASSKETWDAIDAIAFETVPLLREARAIRQAMTLFTEANPSTSIPPWWISFNFPDGVLPEQNVNGINYSAGDALRTCFERVGTAATATPCAFGINCTQVKHLSMCLSLASEALQALGDDLCCSDPSQAALFPHRQGQKVGPALVVYPNGGQVYDPTTMTWFPAAPVPPEMEHLPESEIWVIRLAEAVLGGVPTSANWSGLLIGGCCKTEPGHISSLKTVL